MGIDASVVDAIDGCVSEGCSVEAIMKLDRILAENEEVVVQEQKERVGKTNELKWLDNFLGKTRSLRTQLLAAKPLAEAKTAPDFLKQMIRAASIAFGATPHGNDYPKVGVSPYTYTE